MSEKELASFIEKNPQWTLSEAGIHRSYSYPNYKESLEAVLKVSELAESAYHHPEIEFGWGYVRIKLITYSKSAVTVKDTDLATQIEAALS